MRPRAARCRIATLYLAIVAGVALDARADAQPSASAAELLDSEATALMKEHRYEEACPKLAQSDRLQPGTGVAMRLALCYERSGKTASAWSAFREAAGRARRSGDDALAELASKHVDALEPRLVKVTFRLAPGADPARVQARCDGAPLAPSALGAQVPLDPGPHTLQASMPGRRTFVQTFVVKEGDPPATIAIDLSPATDDGSPAVGEPRTDAGAGGAAGAGSSMQRTMAWVAGGVGVVGLTVGAIFGLTAMSNWNRARSKCTSGFSGCSPDALSLQPAVRDDALWSTVGFAVGAAGIAGAAILWFTAPASSTARHTGYAVAPAVDPHGFAVDLAGRF